MVDGVEVVKPEKIDEEDAADAVGVEQIKSESDVKDENTVPFMFDVQTSDDANDDQCVDNTNLIKNEHEQQVEAAQHSDSIDNLLANLTEDNANSLPSGDDETIFAVTTAPDNNLTIGGNEESSKIEEESGGDVAGGENGTVLIDELIAAEVEELPEPESTRIEADDRSEESITEPAIAEDLPNGRSSAGGDSQSTKMDVDAEMVSEDELPAPSQEKVDDAEEVSDEELPGPKLAELPADTEVVSEDELPTAASKCKRKVDEGYDPCSPTESSEMPEKKARPDDANNGIGGGGGGGSSNKVDVADESVATDGGDDDGKRFHKFIGTSMISLAVFQH